jgi:hypothetical protein
LPGWLWAFLATALAAQFALHSGGNAGPSSRANLEAPPSLAALRLASFGEREAAARLLALHVQSFDLDKVDYRHLVAWLRRILELEPRSQYPLFLAARVYGESPDPARARLALDLAYQEFFVDPDRRWPYLAHAALLAKHRLGDLPLARRYASALQRHARAPDVPLWARQMEVFILEDMNELDAARIMLGGMLESGTIDAWRSSRRVFPAHDDVGAPTRLSASRH